MGALERFVTKTRGLEEENAKLKNQLDELKTRVESNSNGEGEPANQEEDGPSGKDRMSEIRWELKGFKDYHTTKISCTSTKSTKSEI